MLRRLQPAPPSVWWAWACISILAAGGCTMLAPEIRAAVPLGYGLGTSYPALLLAGSLAYVNRRIPRALVPAAFALGAGRGLLELAGAVELAHGAALVFEPPVALLAAALLWRGDPEGRTTLAQRANPPALLAVAALDVATHVSLLGAPAPSTPLVAIWLVAGPTLLALQLAAWGERSRRELERVRDRLEQRVAEQTERYRLVTELSSDWSFSYRVGPDHSVYADWVTDAFTRITGWEVADLEGRAWIEHVPPQARPAVLRQLDAILRRKRTTMEFPMRTKSGQVRWLSVRLGTLDQTEDGLVRLVGATSDITDRKQAAAERRRLEQRMHRTQRMESLGRLAGGIAHDFNNLLTVILGNVDLALEERQGGRVDPRRLKRIQAAARHAAGLTDQVLAYSGKAALALEPLDLSELVWETLDLVRASLAGNAVLGTDLPEGLPAVEGDATQLRQVLLNLATNASEALGGERGLVQIRVGERDLEAADLDDSFGAPEAQAGPYVFLEVTDTGEGFERAARARVFEPFFTSKAPGRGLGLAAVQGIVRAHRGVIRVESDPGRGTSFQVLLPASRRALRPRAELPPAETPATPGRVLVVDDDADVLEVARAYLERGGFEVRSAQSGEAAIELLRDAALEVDAVVLDLVMPDLSGEATYLQIRALRPDLPVVLASGYDREQAAQRFSARGIADFVRKPYEPEELVRSVREALARSPGS